MDRKEWFGRSAISSARCLVDSKAASDSSARAFASGPGGAVNPRAVQSQLTPPHLGKRVSARRALLLLDVVRAVAAAPAQSVRLVVPGTLAGCTLSLRATTKI